MRLITRHTPRQVIKFASGGLIDALVNRSREVCVRVLSRCGIENEMEKRAVRVNLHRKVGII